MPGWAKLGQLTPSFSMLGQVRPGYHVMPG